MAGHSQFKNIMHRKGAQDAKKAKIFTKLIRELMVAARAVQDPVSNNRLRSALIAARTANMPKDTIDRAIKRGVSGEDTAQYEEIRYEGYGPGGIAILIEALTDNRNRTASEIRSAFTKHGGSLGELNSVSYMFDRVGVICYPSTLNQEEFFTQAIEYKAENVEFCDDYYEVLTDFKNFSFTRDQLMSQFGDPLNVAIEWRAQVKIPLIHMDTIQSLSKLVHTLEDNDDVQSVFYNADILQDFSDDTD